MKANILIGLVFVCFSVQGQKIIQNKKYRVDRPITKIVFTPYFNNGGPQKVYNDTLEEIFSKSFDICCQETVMHNLSNHAAFNHLMAKRAYINFEDSFLKHNPNFYDRLSEEEVQIIKNGLVNSDAIILCSEIVSRRVTKVNESGNITLQSSFTVFDLKTGEFMVKFDTEVKTKYAVMDNDAEGSLEDLFSIAREELEKHLK